MPHVTFANNFMCRYQTTMPVNIPYMNSMQSTVWPGALLYIHVTLLVYASEKISLQCNICMSTAIILQSACRLSITADTSQSNNKLQLLFTIVYVQTISMQFNYHIYAMYANCFIWQLCQYKTSHELNAINNVTKRTGIHTFHITGICPQKYACHIAHLCPTTLLL